MVRVALENLFPLRVRGRSVASFHTVRTLRDLEGFRHVALDTSHAAVAGLDPLRALERLRGRVAHVHLSDNAGRVQNVIVDGKTGFTVQVVR